MKDHIQKASSTRHCGFTLIELLVVITVIAVLMAVGVVSYTNAGIKSRDAKRVGDLEQVRTALEMYRADVGSYPTQISWGSIPAILKTNGYLPVIPTDPKPSTYSYKYISGTGYTYELNAFLEKPAAYTQSCSDYTSCGSTCTYCIKNP